MSNRHVTTSDRPGARRLCVCIGCRPGQHASAPTHTPPALRTSPSPSCLCLPLSSYLTRPATPTPPQEFFGILVQHFATLAGHSPIPVPSLDVLHAVSEGAFARQAADSCANNCRGSRMRPPWAAQRAPTPRTPHLHPFQRAVVLVLVLVLLLVSVHARSSTAPQPLPPSPPAHSYFPGLNPPSLPGPKPPAERGYYPTTLSPCVSAVAATSPSWASPPLPLASPPTPPAFRTHPTHPLPPPGAAGAGPRGALLRRHRRARTPDTPVGPADTGGKHLLAGRWAGRLPGCCAGGLHTRGSGCAAVTCCCGVLVVCWHASSPPPPSSPPPCCPAARPPPLPQHTAGAGRAGRLDRPRSVGRAAP